MGKSKIEYCTDVWNAVTGCSKISEGCQNCWAERTMKRFGDDFSVKVHNNRLTDPLKMKQPRVIFVCSMGDLFHKDVSNETVLEVWNIIRRAPQHQFLILTKRPERMFRWTEMMVAKKKSALIRIAFPGVWPDNVWLGITAENQDTLNDRMPWLLRTPSHHRWLSLEPLLGPADLNDLVSCDPGGEHHYDCLFCDVDPADDGDYDGRTVEWIVAGGETGPRAMAPAWIRSVRNQCAAANVPLFFKQWGSWAPPEQVDILTVDKYADLNPFGHIPFCFGKKDAGFRLDGFYHLEFPEALERIMCADKQIQEMRNK